MDYADPHFFCSTYHVFIGGWSHHPHPVSDICSSSAQYTMQDHSPFLVPLLKYPFHLILLPLLKRLPIQITHMANIGVVRTSNGYRVSAISGTTIAHAGNSVPKHYKRK